MTNPTNADSCLKIIAFDGSSVQFIGKGREPYELQMATSLTGTFTRCANPI